MIHSSLLHVCFGIYNATLFAKSGSSMDSIYKLTVLFRLFYTNDVLVGVLTIILLIIIRYVVNVLCLPTVSLFIN